MNLLRKCRQLRKERNLKQARKLPQSITLLAPSLCFLYPKKIKQSRYRPEVPRGFQEVKVPKLRDNGRPRMVVRLPGLRTGRFYPREILLVLISVVGRVAQSV